jgi:hypothetical protein
MNYKLDIIKLDNERASIMALPKNGLRNLRFTRIPSSPACPLRPCPASKRLAAKQKSGKLVDGKHPTKKKNNIYSVS